MFRRKRRSGGEEKWDEKKQERASKNYRCSVNAKSKANPTVFMIKISI